ncbi:putative mitochondrial protein [Dendrobium catenatum]|uniref:Putative mitochondrial protein n=1 Tax=Dendrobium catenatum TaxID=906689 RepID=A0A2I0VYZ5_9ASPA|nr:putative mitochondrial protein [Dendrobium catenatum]
MKEVMNNNDFHDIGFQGPSYTWCNNKEGLARIWERLDRVWLNSKALLEFPNAVVKHLPRISSDHCPVLLQIDIKMQHNKREFKFENLWCSYDAAKGIIAKSWRKNDFGSPNEVLQRKIRRSLKNLYFWSKNKLKELNVKIHELKNEIAQLQECEARDGCLNQNDLLLLRKYQGAFVPGRSISDNYLMAQEITSKMKTSVAKPGFFLVMLDMKQAYDSMCWETLNQVLKLTGFPESLMQLIMQCVSNPKYSIVINGKRTDWIQAKCDFRQGCPLSPSLFILCSDLLSKALVGSNNRLGMKLALNMEKVSHLLFTDDILVVAEASRHNAEALKNILRRYCEWTGQSINSQKSMVLYGKRVKRKRRRKINRILGYKEVKELNYLGIKLTLRRLKTEDFSSTIEKAMSKINSWGARWLSLAGRITLIKSAYSNMISYQVAHSLVSKSILLKLA